MSDVKQQQALQNEKAVKTMILKNILLQDQSSIILFGIFYKYNYVIVELNRLCNL